MKKRNLPLAMVLYSGLVLWALIAALPILWTAIISFRHYVDAFSTPVRWIAPFTFDNYRICGSARSFTGIS